jgi:hypothetical protein
MAHHAKEKKFFLYGCKTPFQMSEWCQTNLQGFDTFVCNDYTAFDQSQRGEALVFECLKMRRFGIPQELIDFHYDLKRNVICQFGPLTSMRLTGEPGTYDDNSDYNLAILNLKYELSDHPVLISGDDSCIAGLPPVRDSWESVEQMITLKFKESLESHPLFCGYYLGALGAVRDPLPMIVKLSIAKAWDKLDLCLASYLAEFTIGHSLGHSLLSVLPEHLHEAQAAAFDFFCRHCSKNQKVLLKLGRVDLEYFSSILEECPNISYSLYGMLKSNLRVRVCQRRRSAPLVSLSVSRAVELKKRKKNKPSGRPR